MSNIYLTNIDNYGGNEVYVFTRNYLTRFLNNLSLETTAKQENFKYAIAYPFPILSFCNNPAAQTNIRISGATVSKWGYPYCKARRLKSITPYKEFYKFTTNQINNIFGESSEWTKSDYYATYTLYLPFAQPISLSANDFKGSTTVRIYVSLDIYSGGLKYYIVREKGINSDVISTISCQVGMRIGVTASTVASAMNSNATSLATSLVGLGGAVAMGTAVGGGVGAVVGGASALLNVGIALNQFSVNTGTSQSVVASGNNASILDPRNAYIKRVWAKPYTPKYFNYTHGRISQDTKSGKDLKGMVWGRPMLSYTGTNMTESERNEIISLFSQGVNFG